jgi:hypothetical protein
MAVHCLGALGAVLVKKTHKTGPLAVLLHVAVVFSFHVLMLHASWSSLCMRQAEVLFITKFHFA